MPAKDRVPYVRKKDTPKEIEYQEAVCRVAT